MLAMTGTVAVTAQTCDEYVADSQNESGFASGGINIYDIYADVCGPERAVLEARQFARVLGAAKKAVTEGVPAQQRGTAVPFETMSLAATVSLPEPGNSRVLEQLQQGVRNIAGSPGLRATAAGSFANDAGCRNSGQPQAACTRLNVASSLAYFMHAA